MQALWPRGKARRRRKNQGAAYSPSTVCGCVAAEGPFIRGGERVSRCPWRRRVHPTRAKAAGPAGQADVGVNADIDRLRQLHPDQVGASACDEGSGDSGGDDVGVARGGQPDQGPPGGGPACRFFDFSK